MHGAALVVLHIVPLSQIRPMQQENCEPAKGGWMLLSDLPMLGG